MGMKMKTMVVVEIRREQVFQFLGQNTAMNTSSHVSKRVKVFVFVSFKRNICAVAHLVAWWTLSSEVRVQSLGR